MGGDRAVSDTARPLPELADYEVLRVLGRGGMGVVYLARHRRLKRLTAVKMLSDRLVEEPRQWSRLTREAEVLARLRHPNVVQVYDVAEQGGQPFLAMEYVEGGSLSDLHRNRPAEPGEAARLVERIARGVHAAHQVGVVHRDLKPANVLIDGGEPKVTDFGLAKEADSGDSLTPTGAVLGTPQYMAPEQVVPGPAASSASVDIYALGAILYDLLTGRPPHVGSNMYETLDLVRRRPPVPPSRLRPGLPAELERICLRCLDKNPARRFESAEAIAEALADFRERWAKTTPPSAALNQRVVLRRAAISVAVLCGAALLAFAAVHFTGDRAEAVRNDAPASHGTPTASSQARARAADPLPAGSSWVGTFTFLPAPDDRIDADARLDIETRSADEFTGTYASEAGRYAWKVRGAVHGDRVRWEFTEAVRDNPDSSVVGRVSVDGTVTGDVMHLMWREPLSGEEARVKLKRE
jgi:serine/threonine-protein kinase